MAAAQEVLDFKTVGEKGIRSGVIKSIIRPELAAHVRREAVRFIDELKRARPEDGRSRTLLPWGDPGRPTPAGLHIFWPLL